MFIVLKVIKRTINKLDLFSSIQLLRFDGDAETKTFTGGLISLGLVIYLISTFSSMILDTFDKVLIQSTSDTNQDDQPQPVYLSTDNNASQFMMGVEVWHFDLTTGPRYFDVIMRNSFMVNGIPGNESIIYNLEPCTKDHWRALQNIEDIFYKVEMNTWLCMPMNITPVLQGKYYSSLQTTFDIVLSACKNETYPDRPCASQEEIDTFMAENGPFYFTPFFYNPLINPQSKNYLSIYLEDKYYIMFGPGMGMEMYVYNAGYQISTDESILPFSQIHYQNGSMITSVATNTYGMGNTTDIYGFISFFRDPATVIYVRNYQKVIDAFSYVGGLLGSFLLVLIFVNFYNQCSYEMRFASMYKVQKDCPTTPKKFNIGYYFLQSVYNVLRTVKVKCEKWRAVKYFHETREEMVRQLDVKYLFKKLHILQNAMMLLLTKSQLRGLMLQHEMTVSEAKKMRRIYNLKSKIKKILKAKDKNVQEEKQKRSQFNLKATAQIFPEFNQNYQTSIANQLNEKKVVNQAQNPIKQSLSTLKRIETFQSSSSQSDQSSQSSIEEESNQKIQKDLIEDLSQLKQQAQNNKISAGIFQNLDPFIKQYLSTNIKSQLKDLKCDTSKDLVSSEIQNTYTFFQIDKKLQDFVMIKRAKTKTKFEQKSQKIEPEQQSSKKSNGFYFLQD